MFRKSVSFFVLVALFWLLLWIYIPDSSPEKLSVSDFFRTLLLLFSFMAFGFTLLLLIIRYKGLDIASNFIPHAGFAMWLGKHAYEYSQPKTVLHCQTNDLPRTKITVHAAKIKHQLAISSDEIVTLDLGFQMQNPTFSWQNNRNENKTAVLEIKPYLKKLGRNIHVNVSIDNDKISYQLQSSKV